MKLFKIAGRDIASIFKNRFIRISVTAIIIVPLLYSLLYLAAFWDPYSRLDKMPVAIVNLDKGGTKNGENISYGKEIEDGLKDNKDLGFKFGVSLEEAKEGLQGDKYYAIFVIPEDFSSKILAVEDGKIAKPSIDYIANEKKNFLAAQINKNVASQIKAKIIGSISDEFTKITFDNLYEVKDGMKEAADGSNKISDGLGTLKDKVPQMQDGVNKLYNGSTALSNGLGELQGKLPPMTRGIGVLNSKVNIAAEEFNKHPELQGLTDEKTINSLKSVVIDAKILQSSDTSALEMLPSIAASKNIGLMNKTFNDFKAIDINKAKNLIISSGVDNLMSTENINNLSKLMKDTESLSKLNVNKVQPLIGLMQQSGKLKGIMDEASNLSKVDISGINSFIQAQKVSSKEFITNSQALNTHKNELEAAIKTNQNLTPAQVTQLLAVIEGYNTLTAETSKQMEDSASAMNRMSENLYALSKMQKDLKDNSEVIEGVKDALSDENITYLNSVLPELLEVKKDLDSNAKNLAAVKGVLQAVDTADLKDTLTKVKALESDLVQVTPIIESLEKNITPQQLASIQASPALVNQLLKMKQDLNDNAKVLEVAENALSDKNIAMAKGLIASIPELKNGVNQLYVGSNQLANGVNKLSNGSIQLTEGLKELNSKVPELSDGVNKLYNGSKGLSTKLEEGSDELNSKLKVKSEDMGEFVSEPITLNEAPVNKVPNYGTGFTPYFIPLSLWVGALMMFFVITDKVDDELGASPASIVVGKFLSYGFIGVMQAVLASAAVLTLGLKTANIPLFFLFNIFLSFVFIAIIQSLIFLLGDAGRLLSIVLLILQLTSSGGTFPLEVVPRFFKFLNPLMPFTYATGGLREIISGVDYSVLGHDTVILAVTMIIFLIISVLMKGHADKVQEKIRLRKELTA